jgi:RNAse (barnase) inhibitor barstar
MSVAARYQYKELAPIAEAFLREHRTWEQIPVPIEEIADLKLGINICPLPGLMRAFDIDAFSSSNFDSITVDEDIYLHNANRYRFSLAHEVSHRLLHRDLFAPYQFSRIEEYIVFQTQLDEKDRAALEWQANSLAGHILMPSPFFDNAFAEALEDAKLTGLNLTDYWDLIVSYISLPLALKFAVSEQAVQTRVTHARLRERHLTSRNAPRR